MNKKRYNEIYNEMFGGKSVYDRPHQSDPGFRKMQVLAQMQMEAEEASRHPSKPTSITEMKKEALINKQDIDRSSDYTPGPYAQKATDYYKNLTPERSLNEQSKNLEFPNGLPPEYDPSVLNMVKDWALGTGQNHINFDENSKNTKNMMDAYRVNQARNYYLKNKNPYSLTDKERHYTNVKGKFGISGMPRAGLDPTEQFVGSYRIDINSRLDDRNKAWLDYELNNNSSMKSFLYGIGPEWERGKIQLPFNIQLNRPFGNMRQTYRWTEPYDPTLIEKK